MTADPALTVIGAQGFVGGRLVRQARDRGLRVLGVGRADLDALAGPLGHVVYAVGMTADFRTKPFETIEAHVGLLARLLPSIRCESFLYLSSTRIYRGASSTDEATPLSLDPNDPDRLYDLSKALGESLCLSRPDPRFRAARLSNVFGPGERSANFLSSVIDDAVRAGRVEIGQAPTSEKDYVAVEDVCDALIHIATRGQKRLYNVAAGRNVTHRTIAEGVARATGAEVAFAPGGPEARLAPISVDRLRSEMDWRPRPLEVALADLVRGVRETKA